MTDDEIKKLLKYHAGEVWRKQYEDFPERERNRVLCYRLAEEAINLAAERNEGAYAAFSGLIPIIEKENLSLADVRELFHRIKHLLDVDIDKLKSEGSERDAWVLSGDLMIAESVAINYFQTRFLEEANTDDLPRRATFLKNKLAMTIESEWTELERKALIDLIERNEKQIDLKRDEAEKRKILSGKEVNEIDDGERYDRHPDISQIRALLFFIYAIPELKPSDKEKDGKKARLGILLNFLTGLGGEKGKKIAQKFSVLGTASEEDVRIVAEYLRLAGLDDAAKQLEREMKSF